MIVTFLRDGSDDGVIELMVIGEQMGELVLRHPHTVLPQRDGQRLL